MGDKGGKKNKIKSQKQMTQRRTKKQKGSRTSNRNAPRNKDAGFKPEKTTALMSFDS